MRFNSKYYAVLGLALLPTLGCGMLGNKTPPTGPAGNVGVGCLNDSKGLVTRYTSGQVTHEEWSNAFNCVNQSLDFFTQYVHGSTTTSYTQSDMYTFVSQFLITNHTVQQDLLRGAFQLKASVLGGTSAEFTKDEIATLQSILPKVRDITATLIPYLAALQNPVSGENYQPYFDIAEAFKTAGDQMAEVINQLPVGMLSEQSVSLLIDQLSATLDFPVMDGLATKAFLGKWLLFNTRPDALQQNDWAQLVRSALGLGGLAIIATKANPTGDIVKDYHYREFIWEVAKRARPYIDDAIQFHNGVIPLPLIDHLVDQIPSDFISAPSSVLKQTLRPVFRKILGSSTQMGIDEGVVNTLYSLGSLWIQNIGMVDRVYEASNLDPLNTSAATLKTAMDQYASNLQNSADQLQFGKVEKTILGYIPQFYKDTQSVYYGPGLNYTKFQHFFVLTVQQLVEHIHDTYGSGDDYFVASDFDALYKDYIDLLFAFKAVDPTVAGWPGKRFQELDIFTPASDGNGQASYQEIVYYAMTLISAGNLKNRMIAEIMPRCDQSLGQDILGVNWISAGCFRNEFETNFDHWLDYFPNLKSYWATLDPTTQAKAMIWLEHGSRRNGYTEENFASYDFQSMPTILHYAESMFSRFDSGGGDILSKSDIMNAFPVFQALLAAQPGAPSSTSELKGIFTYIVHYREEPDTTTAAGAFKVLGWLMIYNLPTTHVSTDRAGIYNIICLLGKPESLAQQALTKTICAP